MTRIAIAIALLVVIVAWGTRIAEGRRDLGAANAAIIAGDRLEAIVYARAAAEARCPGCASPDLGYAKLQAIAAEAEGRADNGTAVAAWRAVRTATLASAVFDRESARREQAEAQIARLQHRIDLAAAAAGAQSSPAASEERLKSVLATNDLPSGLVFLLLALGGGVFLVFAFRFARASAFRPAELVGALLGAATAIAGVVLF